MQHLNITVSGKVQGVFFRVSTREKADQLGVCGWVMNHSDGTVRIAAEADAEKMQAFTDWLTHGPANARVEKLESENGQLQDYTEFTIK